MPSIVCLSTFRCHGDLSGVVLQRRTLPECPCAHGGTVGPIFPYGMRLEPIWLIPSNAKEVLTGYI